MGDTATLMDRVRNVIQRLDYAQLLRKEIIPDLMSCWDVEALSKSVRYPKWAYPNNFSLFGVWLEWILHYEHKLASGLDPELSAMPYTKRLEKLFQRAVQQMGVEPEPPDAGVYKKINQIRSWYQKCDLQEYPFRMDMELEYKTVEGHPDLINQSMVLDVKTCSKFTTHASEHCLQVLSYVALARACGYKCEIAGFVLPMQQRILMADVSDWDETQFLTTLLKNVAPSLISMTPTFGLVLDSECDPSGVSLITMADLAACFDRLETGGDELEGIGTHIREADLTSKQTPSRPYQVFLRNSQNGACAMEFKKQEINFEHDRITKYRDLTSKGYRIFVHGAYIINLCNPFTKKNLSSDAWVLNLAINDLKIAQTCGLRGVVIHMGKHVNKDPKYKRMYKSLDKILEYATEECPLILETSCGAGTETGSTVEDLSKIYSQMLKKDPKNKERLRICIDTAHVHAAGYDPYDYLSQWTSKHPGSLVLVHFNDSRFKRSSHRDGHSVCGTGYIGEEVLRKVAALCHKLGVPMVTE